jgi:hypothetical protein
MIKCPKCGLTNPDSTAVCDCSYPFPGAEAANDLPGFVAKGVANARPEILDEDLTPLVRSERYVRALARTLFVIAGLQFAIGLISIMFSYLWESLLMLAVLSAIAVSICGAILLSKSRVLCVLLSIALVLMSLVEILAAFAEIPILSAITSILVTVLVVVGTVRVFRYRREVEALRT